MKMIEKTGTSYEVFENTMADLEQTLIVRHIATFEMVGCHVDEQATSVFKRYPDFDQFPVSRNGNVIGVMDQKPEDDSVSVGACMRALDEAILVAAGQSLSQFLPLMTNAPYYRLVLRGRKIDGIVTRSDLLKLPVRLLAFARVTHLELLMANLIQKRDDGSNQWLALLQNDRLNKVQWKKKKLKRGQADPPLIELTEFRDKRDIVAQFYRPGEEFDDDMEQVIELRHQLAHASDYAEDIEKFEEFLTRIDLADSWISRLSQLTPEQASY